MVHLEYGLPEGSQLPGSNLASSGRHLVEDRTERHWHVSAHELVWSILPTRPFLQAYKVLGFLVVFFTVLTCQTLKAGGKR